MISSNRQYNQDFELLDAEQMRVIINLPQPTEGYQRVKINESLISHPASLSVTKFAPINFDFTVANAPVKGNLK